MVDRQMVDKDIGVKNVARDFKTRAEKKII